MCKGIKNLGTQLWSTKRALVYTSAYRFIDPLTLKSQYKRHLNGQFFYLNKQHKISLCSCAQIIKHHSYESVPSTESVNTVTVGI